MSPPGCNGHPKYARRHTTITISALPIAERCQIAGTGLDDRATNRQHQEKRPDQLHDPLVHRFTIFRSTANARTIPGFGRIATSEPT